MTRDEAKKTIEKQASIVRMIFEKAGEVAPLFRYHGIQGTRVIAPPDFDGDDAKDFVSAVVRNVLRRDRAEWVLHISEAWMLFLPADAEIPDERPSEHPDRVEVVLYQLEDHEAGTVSASQRIIRSERKPYLDALNFDPETIVSMGRFVDLLPRKGRAH